MTNRLPALILLTALTAAVPALAQRAATTGSYNDDFGVLSDRNMFLRDRQAPQVYKPRTRPVGDSPTVIARSYVLRGVAIEDAELHAYLENRRTGDVARVAPGDKLADGTVVDIAIDAIAFNVDGKTTWIDVGQNLMGARSTEAADTSTTSSSPASTQPAAPGAPLPPGASLEERLKARRAQMRGSK